ncbi:MAG: MBOAT family protein [Clostridia bacterium]|nr:MBOAT family protein [Clostridia bacterium]
MVFSSFVFLLLFLPFTLILYYAVPCRAKNGILFFLSLVFYAWGEPIYILIMLFSTVFDYFNGLMLERLDKKKKEKGRTAVLILSVVVNIGLLCFFKYMDFAIETVSKLGGLNLRPVGLALPIGISFYTFQTLSYTIDVYRKKVKAQHNILNFGMYICMFPQLIAGPIVRYADIENQIDIRNRGVSADTALGGAGRFIRGLGKKVIIANTAGALWAEISAQNNATALTAWLGTFAFALQIFFDFSGYSDMAIGLAKMFGFKLNENFNYPYMSKSITEFWRRWHISLSTWFKEYVYIPLGGNRKGVPRQIVNLFIVWFLTGLWHGAGWNFVLWGLYFFVLLTIEKLFFLKWLSKLPAVIRHIYTMLAVLVSWAIFAGGDMGALFAKNGLYSSDFFYYIKSYAVIILLGIIFSTDYPKKLFEKYITSKAVKYVITALIAALSVLMLIGDSYNPFLYFRF